MAEHLEARGLLRGGTIVDATHVGVDASSGLVHTAGVTSGSVHDAKMMDRLVRDDDTAVYGDKGYASDAKKRAAEEAGVLWAVKEKAKPGGRLTARQRARNHRFGKVRAKVEHVFRVLSASSAIARCVIAASPRTAPRCSRCWRSQTCISSAGHLRPPDENRPFRSRPPL